MPQEILHYWGSPIGYLIGIQRIDGVFWMKIDMVLKKFRHFEIEYMGTCNASCKWKGLDIADIYSDTADDGGLRA